MKNEQHLIPVQEFCTIHQVELAFIDTLNEYGLISVTMVKATQYIYTDQLSNLEKLIRLHYDLGINLEGIHAISHLLQRVDSLHEELTGLRNRLNLYEVRDSAD
jgi:DNA-binding transcriptional MerR regulator